MTVQVNTGQMQLNPLALLATILFRAGDVAKVSVQHDDSKDATEVLVPFVQIEKEGNNLVCTLPFADLIRFSSEAMDFSFQVLKPDVSSADSEAVAVIGFSKPEMATRIVSASGKPIVTGNPTMDKLMEKLMGRNA